MAFIRHIEKLVPDQSYTQSYACDVMLERSESRRAKKYIQKIYSESGIERRFSVVEDFAEGVQETRLFHQSSGGTNEPTTGERNAVFVEEAKRMVPEIARNALRNCPGVEAADITHVITVSCTGFFNPGPDLLVIDALGLAPTVERYHLGFMGCYAAFPALKMADQFCRLDSSANILIVCIELCSLHLQIKDDLDSIVANSVFADGLAAAVVSATGPPEGERGYSLSRFSSSLAREGKTDMAWDIGDKGFNIVLSKYVAKIIGAGIKGIVEEVFSGSNRDPEQIDRWAIHPGGRAILDKIEESLSLRPEQIAASRSVLSQFGNMSSVTILFVLAEILGDPGIEDGESICAMAFGPGLTIETSVLDAVVS